MSGDDAVFEASRLGTREYWDEAYQVELENLKDHGDEGEIWFGKQCEKRIVGWCATAFGDKAGTRVLDIGSGNGHMLLSLGRKGFACLQGVDYSVHAGSLGRALFEEHPEVPQAVFQCLDFLAPDQAWLTGRPAFDLLVDKGTFDAISLMPGGGKSGSAAVSADKKAAHLERVSEPCALFKASLLRVWASPASRFVLTSCNWTRAELAVLFGPEFAVEHQIEHPSFVFGGASGQVVTTLVFQRAAA